MPTPKYDPDERFKVDRDPEDVLRRLLDDEKRDDERGKEKSPQSR